MVSPSPSHPPDTPSRASSLPLPGSGSDLGGYSQAASPAAMEEDESEGIYVPPDNNPFEVKTFAAIFDGSAEHRKASLRNAFCLFFFVFFKIGALRAHLLRGARTQPAGYTTVYIVSTMVITP